MIKLGRSITGMNEAASDKSLDQLKKYRDALKASKVYQQFLTASGDDLEKLLRNKSTRPELDRCFEIVNKMDKIRRDIMNSSDLNEALDVTRNPESTFGTQGLEVSDKDGNAFYSKANRLFSDLAKNGIIKTTNDVKAVYSGKDRNTFVIDTKDGKRIYIKGMGRN